MLEHTRTPQPASPGTLARVDDEYKRCGTANIFLCVEPLTGQTVVKATDRRTKTDFAHFIRDLCDGPYRDADKLVVVMDNLNTHSLASLYEAFPPAEARRLVEKLEIHYTPKHGSWLDIAEIELSVLARQCLHQRIASMVALQEILQSWEEQRNAGDHSVSWRFATEDARLVIEIDGGQHYTQQGTAHDSRRDAYLNSLGLSVLRFSNLDVLGNMDGVIAELLRYLNQAPNDGETKSP